MAGAEAEVIESGEVVVGVHLGNEGFEFGGVPKEHGSEIEVVPQCTKLVVDDRCFANHPRFFLLSLP